MKVAILGYSGSGKSTLARQLGAIYNIPVLHLDSVKFTTNWQERDPFEAQKMIQNFMQQPDWIIEGNYKNYYIKKRLKQATYIIELDFNRVYCFIRCMNRFIKYHGQTREDLPLGCKEKMDYEFISWLLYKGRLPRHAEFLRAVRKHYNKKTIVMHNQHELDLFLKFIGFEHKSNHIENIENIVDKVITNRLRRPKERLVARPRRCARNNGRR
ncbi:hypothetical protein AN643_01380 [Candidatus Epulonipiscioides saccharophilum]|nr:hypothetical protein AN643_01380 [Epulopiscium sp. SCG-B10WGA-EpuloB]